MTRGIVSPDQAGVTLLAMTQALTAFNAYLPPIGDVRKASADTELASDVRMGELMAGTLTVAVGATAAAVIGNAAPFWISVLAAAALVALYEWTLRGRPFSQPTPLHAVPTEGM